MKIQWKYDLCEKPYCEQLKRMGWQWLEGHTDVPYLTDATISNNHPPPV